MDEYSLSKNQRRNNMSNKHKDPKRKAPKDSMIGIYEDTIAVCNEMNLDGSNSILYDITDFDTDLTTDKNVFNEAIDIRNMDTLDMAHEYVKSGLKPLVLNMASDFKPGGGVASGKTAQEECLFRRSNAFQTHPSELYPLNWNQVIYSPVVTVIKDASYERIEPFDIGMIAVAGLRKPKLIGEKYQLEDRKIMTQKIESIFKVAKLHGHDSLVLGALGCGVFMNPPYEVAGIFKTMLSKYSFKRVGFAILSKGDTNFQAFKDVLKF